jgi:hypothetical protein
VFYAVLGRLDQAMFASRLSDGLLAHAGTLPQALAMDGKMISDHLGLLTLAPHEDGDPQAVAVYDQKEGTPRREQVVATALPGKLPALDGKLITADALHCPKANARAGVEKSGDDLLQVKGNQLGLLAQAAGVGRAPGPPYFCPDEGWPRPGRSARPRRFGLRGDGGRIPPRPQHRRGPQCHDV